MPMPNFLVIGTAHAGTTSLFHYLKQHPQIYLSPVKEPRFFAFEGEAVDFRGPGDERFRKIVITDIKDYGALFEGVAQETAIGEISPVYLYSPKAPERIRHYVPGAKLIAILRDPIERAYSSFLGEIRAGREPLRDFAEALQNEGRRIRENWSYVWHYKQRGFYYSQLRRYLERFDRSQIKIVLYDDWEADNVGTLREIFRFLEVDDCFIPDVSVRHNVSLIPRIKLLHEALTSRRRGRCILRPFLLARAWQRMRRGLTKRNLVRPKLPLSVRKHLVEEYQADILRLQDAIGRDFSKWLQP